MHAVFLRAANVGGNNVFKPAAVARELAALEVVNVGAAGTFVVRAKASAAAIRKAFREKLPIRVEMAVCPARDVLALVASAPWKDETFSKDLRGWAAPLCAKPTIRPELPLASPAGKGWWVRLERVEGSFALGLWRRRPGTLVFPNAVVERALGVPATTRWWETFERVAALMVG